MIEYYCEVSGDMSDKKAVDEISNKMYDFKMMLVYNDKDILNFECIDGWRGVRV